MRTVRVPDDMAGLFAAAEEVVSRYFRDRRDAPERGTIEISGERYVLVRAASLSVEFFSMVYDLYGPGRERDAEGFARNILYDLAHAIGRSDARNFHTRMGLQDPIARLSAGPVHFAHTGWAFVDISPESNPQPGPDFLLVYEHPYSFEADAWQRARESRSFPACIMNAGYSSGWCAESFSMTLVATEIECRARGDATCRFLMAQPDRIEHFLQRYAAERPELLARLPDVTIPDFFSRKRMEEELRRAQSDLEQRVAERTEALSQSYERLQKEMAEREEVEKRLRSSLKLEALGRLAGGIAHDFNNLVGVIMGHASILARRLPEGDPIRPHLDEIAAAGRRAARLTHQLLAVGRADVPRREVVALSAVVGEVGGMLGRVIGESVEVVLVLGDDAGYVEMDRGQLEQVVMNLAVNARDAMPSGGTLRIETKRVFLDTDQARAREVEPGPYAAVVVEDTGIGMDEHTLARVFDPFFTTKDEGKGSGLGLATVYGIVKQSAGAVTAESEVGRGARFCVLLPTVAKLPTPVPRPSEEVVMGRGSVLLVEDQAPLRSVVRQMLEELGYTCLEAQSPEDALRIGDADPSLSLLLTDVVMPRLTGREVARRLKQTHPALRVLFMSGYVDDAQLREEIAQGGAAFLQKPFTSEELGEALRRVARGDEPAPPAPDTWKHPAKP